MALATRAAFEARHGALAEDQITAVDAYLEDASALIHDEVADADAAWITSETTPPPATVVAICVQVAYRAFVNPDALSQERLGEASASYRGDAAEAIYLTDREKAAVRRAARRNSFVSVPLESPYSGPAAGSSLDFDLGTW